MKNKSALALAGLLAAAALLWGCARQQQGSSSNAGGKHLRLAFVTNNASDFWTIARRGTEKADQELDNVDVEFRIASDGTAAEQKRIVDDLLAKGIDGMAISPVDPANQTQMINDAAKRILVITQDSDAPQSDRTCYIGTDNRAAGRQAGDLIKASLPQGGKIMVFVGKADAQNARERLEGVKEAIQGAGIEIIDVRTDDADRVRAKSNAADTIVKYPDVAALVGLWAYNGPAILSAVKDANKTGQVKIIAFDEEDDTLKGIKDGFIEGTIVQQPYQFGYQSVKTMAQILGGDRSMIPPTKQILVPTRVIKKENVDDFIKEINQLRGRS
jgi:ribose transport system substrate-binding protein